MKGDVYYLINSDGYTTCKFEFTDDYMTGVCYECYTWDTHKNPLEYHYVADVYCKWDSCTHWWFRGQDYDSGDNDSYYHLCGSGCFTDHIRAMCFVWRLAAMTLIKDENYSKSLKPDIARYYIGDDKTRQLVSLMLDGYTIKKENENNGRNTY